MILKNETQGNFVLVNQCIMHDKSLKMFDRGLLITLMSLPDNWNFTINGLASIISDGRDAIRNGLERLQEKGYLVKEQLREHGKFADICIRINVTPKEPLAEKPMTKEPIPEKPSTEMPSTTKPVSGNPTQLNNKESNIQESNNHKSNTQGFKSPDGKGAKYGTDSGAGNRSDKNGFCRGPKAGSPCWSKDEIDLYGL